MDGGLDGSAWLFHRRIIFNPDSSVFLYNDISITNLELPFPDGASTVTMLLPTDSGGYIPDIHGDFIRVNWKAQLVTPLPYRSIDNAISFELSYYLAYGRIHYVSEWSGVQQFH